MGTRDERRALHGEEYVRRFERLHAESARLDRLLPLLDLRPGDTVADLGCGSGLLLPLIAGRIGRYLGVDFSPAFIQKARERKARLGISNAEFFCEAIPDFCGRFRGAVDVALALDVAEHVPDDEWLAILRAVRGILAPGGRLLLHTPNADFLPEIMKRRGILLRQFPEHVAVRNAAGNISLLRDAGFGRSTVSFLPHYNILRAIHPLSRLPLVGRFLRARLLITAEA